MVTISFCLAEPLLIYDKAKTDSEGAGQAAVSYQALILGGQGI